MCKDLTNGPVYRRRWLAFVLRLRIKLIRVSGSGAAAVKAMLFDMIMKILQACHPSVAARRYKLEDRTTLDMFLMPPLIKIPSL